MYLFTYLFIYLLIYLFIYLFIYSWFISWCYTEFLITRCRMAGLVSDNKSRRGLVNLILAYRGENHEHLNSEQPTKTLK